MDSNNRLLDPLTRQSNINWTTGVAEQHDELSCTSATVHLLKTAAAVWKQPADRSTSSMYSFSISKEALVQVASYLSKGNNELSFLQTLRYNLFKIKTKTEDDSFKWLCVCWVSDHIKKGPTWFRSKTRKLKCLVCFICWNQLRVQLLSLVNSASK